jgi:putative SOS response-associated peptidase YedK
MTHSRQAEVYAVVLGVKKVPDLQSSWNIAPSLFLLAARVMDGQREAVALKWGFVPSWSKDTEGWINARSETAATKPAFRSAFKSRRCLIAADGWYEWKKEKKGKQPYYFHPRDGKPIVFAGL